MIICHCQRISDKDIHAAIDWMRAADPEAIVTPGKIFHSLRKSAVCGGCMKSFVTVMRDNRNTEVPIQLRNLRGAVRQEG